MPYIRFDVHLECPAPPAEIVAADDLLVSLRRLDGLWSSRSGEIPLLEHCLARQLMVSRRAAPAPYQRFLGRAPAEPIIRSRWSQLISPSLNEDQCGELATALGGPGTVFRQGMVGSGRDLSGRRSVYPRPAVAHGWLTRIKQHESEAISPLARSFYAYAETAISHPLNDGNGRLARAMLYRALGAEGILSAPLLPLGPLIYANTSQVIEGVVRLGTQGDWAPLAGVLEGLIRKAAAFSEWSLTK